jgi:anti-anti-sigma factor
MNTDRTAATADAGARDGSGVPRSTRRRPTPRSGSPGGRAAPDASRSPMASVRPWAHTLIVTGELNSRSAAELEAAIDALFEMGVTGITLDLRELEEIDSVGATVLAFRCGLCERRGYGFAVIPGSPEIRAALAAAGVNDLLAREPDDDAPGQRPALLLGGRSRGRREHRGA